MKCLAYAIAVCMLWSFQAAGVILFDFDNAPVHTSFPSTRPSTG